MSRRAESYSTCCVFLVIGPEQKVSGKISTSVTELLPISLLDASGPLAASEALPSFGVIASAWVYTRYHQLWPGKRNRDLVLILTSCCRYSQCLLSQDYPGVFALVYLNEVFLLNRLALIQGKTKRKNETKKTPSYHLRDTRAKAALY